MQPRLTRSSSQGALVPLNPEIDRAWKQQRKKQQGVSSSTVGPLEVEELDPPSPFRIHSESSSSSESDCEEDKSAINMNDSPLKSAFVPTAPESPSCIAFTVPNEANFSIPVQLLGQLPKYSGSPMEDPNVHLREFLDICRLQSINHLTPEGLKLLLFPFTLKDDAKRWLYSLPAGIITNWNEMTSKFLKQFFPAQLTKKLRREIQNFTQKDGDTLYEAWEEFQELQRKCPHHGISLDELVQAFYEGLDNTNKGMVDSACGCMFMNKTGR